MLLRAVFWIGLVSVLMPHEPDLGFGRPHTGVAFSPDLCGHQSLCTEAVAFVGSFRPIAIHSLAQVKIDIDENRRARLLTPR